MLLRRICQRVCLSSVVLSLSLFTACSGDLSEKEPENDKRKNAQQIKSGQIFRGTFYSGKGTDTDFVFLRVSGNAMIKGELSGVKGIDSEIRLYRKGRAAPFKIINDQLSSLGEKFGPILVEEPGVVIALKTRKPVNQSQYTDLPYQFKVNTFSPPQPVEREPNDSYAEAQQIDENITGYYSNVYISSTGGERKEVERDFFFVELTEEKKYRIQIDLTGVAGVDPVLRLFDYKKNLLKVVDDKGLGQGETVPAYGVEGPDRLYMSVTAKDYRINENEYYQLEVDTSEYENKYEFEPNDSREKASDLTEEETMAEISDAGDIDWFQYQNRQQWPVILRVELVPERSFNPVLELYNSRGAKIHKFNNGEPEENEGISNRVLKPDQVIFLKVTSVEHSVDGPAEYLLKLNSDQLVDVNEVEPNDRPPQANEILPDSTVVGYINPNKDFDYFKVKIDKQQRFKVLLDALPDCRLSLKVADRKSAVFDKAGSERAGEGISLTTVLEPGGFIQISCEKALSNLYKTPYKLTIQSEALWED